MTSFSQPSARTGWARVGDSVMRRSLIYTQVSDMAMPKHEDTSPYSFAWNPHFLWAAWSGSGIGAIPVTTPAGHQGHSAPVPTDLHVKILFVPFANTQMARRKASEQSY